MPPYELTGAIQPMRVSIGYRLGLLVVAVAMLVLPLIYLGLIAGVGWISWWHLSSNTWILARRLGGWQLAGYLGPAIAGLTLTFFMVKPILARPARGADPIVVERQDDPELHAFIDAISRQVRAPSPRRVQVDCMVNASASFSRFPLPLVSPSLTLTIGLPLAGGLTVRQLGGVIAHEFGHFAQGGGMRLTYLVRSINAWFGRVVYERDAWDQKLDRWSRRGHWMLIATLMLARGAIWCSRQVLHGLMYAGHGLSCFMLRQMEYDADSYEVKLVGSRTFLETSARMRELNVHYHMCHRDLHEAWMRKALPDDVPAFLFGQARHVPPDVAARIRETPIEDASLFDTHPTDADRAAAAEAIGGGGILAGGNDSATVLFRDFTALSRAATKHHYEHHLGVDLATAPLVETEQVVRLSERRHDGGKSTEAFYGAALSWLRPIRFTWPPADPVDPATLAADALSTRDGMAAEAAGVAEALRRMESLYTSRCNVAAAEELIESGFRRVTPADFDLTDGTLRDAQETAARIAAQERELLPRVEAHEALAGRRLSAALALAAHADPAGRGAELDAMAPAYLALAARWSDLLELYRLSTMLQHVGSNIESSPAPETAAKRADILWQQLRAIGRRLAAGAEAIAVPAGVGSADATTLDALLGLGQFDRGDILGTDVLTRAITARIDATGRLTAIALQAEVAVADSRSPGVQESRIEIGGLQIED